MIAKRTKNRHLGLLPRMDARQRADGGYTYRYLTHDRRYINLGRDRADAIRKVLEMERRAPTTGTVLEMVRAYLESTTFAALGKRTQADYLAHSKHIIRVFGEMRVSDVKPPHVARYLRIERKEAPVQANREIAFFSSAFQEGIEQGLAESNPCRQVRRNTEKPRSRLPSHEDIESFLDVAKQRGAGSELVGIMARFAAITGRRRAEFLRLRKDDLTEEGVKLTFAKERSDAATKTGLIGWTPTLRQVIADAKAIRYPSKKPRPSSIYVFANRAGRPYTEQGFKSMWSKIMADWLAADRDRERFTFHDLRAYYVTEMVGRNKNPETHANPATTRRVYDRRRVVKITASS